MNRHRVAATVRKSLFGITVSILSLLLPLVGCESSEATSPPAHKGPVTYYGELTVKGNMITGAKTGKPAQVKGASFFWSNWSAPFWTPRMVDRLVDEFKVEVVRFAWGVQDNGVPYPENSKTLLRAAVDRALERDIFVILDWHSHGAHLNPQAALQFFSEMAEAYGKHDHVIFELYNEPLQIPWTTIKTYSEEVSAAIRVHSDNLIIVGTPTWSQDIDIAAANPVTTKNVAYALHFYVPNHGTGVSSKVQTAHTRGAALFASEWGFWTKESWCQCNFTVDQWMSLLDERQISWCMWAVNDKEEVPSIFAPGSGTNGALSETGRWFKNHLEQHSLKAPWRN